MAFDKDVMMRCVTLSGDLFDPVGTLTGGIYILHTTVTILHAIMTMSCIKISKNGNLHYIIS